MTAKHKMVRCSLDCSKELRISWVRNVALVGPNYNLMAYCLLAHVHDQYMMTYQDKLAQV